MGWHKIPGISGYEITKKGQIRSWLDRGRNRRRSTPYVKNPTAHSLGAYVHIKGNRYKVAALLAMTFLRAPKAGERVIFKDGNTRNIDLGNLGWNKMSQRSFDEVVDAAVENRLERLKSQIAQEIIDKLKRR